MLVIVAVAAVVAGGASGFFLGVLLSAYAREEGL